MNIDQNKSNNESSKEAPPEFSDLFGGGSSEDSPMDLLFGEDSSKEKAGNDLSQKGFLPVEKLFEEKPLPIFAEKGYYQKALSGEGEPSKRFHNFLSQYLNSDDPKEKSAIRNKLISAYWDLTENISKKVFEDLPTPKKYALRFGAILPNLLSADLRKLLSVIIDENDTGEPIHYFDEWLEQISSGDINPSTTDELRPTRKKTDKENIKPQLDKHKGQEKSLINLIQRKQSNLVDYENILKEKVSVLMVKRPNPKYNGLNYAYSSDHRRAITELSMTIKDLNRIDKEISTLYSDLDKNDKILAQLKEKAEAVGATTQVDTSVVVKEFSSVRQMAKMCVGRQGNHIPFLMKQYFPADRRNIGTRENVITQAAKIEAIDPGLFLRTFKRETNRIVPHFILLPCYGETGICWEPFEKFNKGSSRGRVAIPMYSKDLRRAVITALADLRWQVAKEKAAYYWMEEGLTGHYYQWFSERKLKGDVKERFVNDYVLWVTKECEGTQKLERDVRGIFWRDIPFPEEIRNSLKNRGFVYNELYKKDINRSMSDGY